MHLHTYSKFLWSYGVLVLAKGNLKESEPFLEQVPELHELLLPPAELRPLGRQLLLKSSHLTVSVLGQNLLVFFLDPDLVDPDLVDPELKVSVAVCHSFCICFSFIQ